MSKFKELEEKYKELGEKYNSLKSSYDLECNINNTCREKLSDVEKENRDIKKELEEARSNIRHLEAKLVSLIDENKINTEIVGFLITEKCEKDPLIEFAGIKTYRDGWKALYVGGEEINARKHDNVTIFANTNEPVQVEVSTT